MSISMLASSSGPKVHDPLPFSVFRYVHVFASYLDALHVKGMHVSDRAVAIRVRHNVLCDKDVGPASNVGCPVVDVAYLCGAVSVPKLIDPSVPATKMPNMISICRHLGDDSMGSCYPKMVGRLSSHVAALFTCNLPDVSIIGQMTATSRFVGISMRGV